MFCGYLGLQKEGLYKGACGFLLLLACFIPRTAMSLELKFEIPNVNYEKVISNSLLLQETSSLELEHYSFKVVLYNENLLNQTTNDFFYEEGNGLFTASGSLNLNLSHLFIKEDSASIYPLTSSLHFPPLVQPPEKSSLPDPLSLLMLSIGAVVLLAWSRRKRYLL